ncbi:phospho-N-acetylmuramoyl-pentapeptide-transferase [Synergistales bacterium]|nr:phospho-N-acetylmuramoyl-pentapeptide-transferase [Synergistales bacterium]
MLLTAVYYTAWASLIVVLSFFVSATLQFYWIALQRFFHMWGEQKTYGVGLDIEIKRVTPAMGGVVFIVMGLLALIFLGRGWEGAYFWELPLMGGAVGLTDDWIKYSKGSSEGLRSLGKLFAQVIVAAIWVLWGQNAGVSFSLWPGLSCPHYIEAFLTALAVVVMMNAVNVTDGLDGLAGGMFLFSMFILTFLLPTDGDDPIFRDISFLFGMCGGFLVYNIHPAKTFMGDAGSHFLGCALVALCVKRGMLLALIPSGFLFGVELLSSAIQIFAIRVFHKKIFKMAPLHHHFQLIGWKETTVTSRFLLFHVLSGLLFTACILFLKR